MSRGATRSALRTLAAGLRQLLAVRWVRALAVLALLFVAGRIALPTVLATAVSRLAAQRELAVSWEDLDLSLSGGEGSVRWLTIAPLAADGEVGDPLLELEYAVFDLDVLRLLRGDVSIRRAEVDGADLHFERDADGGWNFEQHVAAGEVLSLLEGKPKETEPEQTLQGKAPTPIDLVPPLAVEALRLQHARLHLVDRAVEPARSLTLKANAYLSSLLTSSRPTRFGLELFGDDLIDTARVDGQASWGEDAMRIELRAQASARNLHELGEYLEPLRVRPIARTLEGGLTAVVELFVVGERRDALGARVELSEVHLTSDGNERFSLGRLGFEAESLAADRARLVALEISGARGAVDLRSDGALRVAGFDLLAPERKPRPPLAWEDVVASVLDLATPGALPRWIALAGSADPEAWPWSLERLAVQDCAFEVVDYHIEPAATFALQVVAVELTGFEHDPTAEPRAIPFSARMAAPGLADSILVSGSVQPWAPRRQLDLALDVTGIAPASADAYLASAGLERTLADGRLQLTLTAEATEEDGVTRGWIQTREVALADSGELFGVRELAVRDVVIDPAASRLRLGEMIVSGPRLAFVRDPAASFLALGLRVGGRTEPDDPTAPEEADEPTDAPAAPAVAREPREPVILEIGRAAWLDSRVTFLDQSTDPPTTLAIDELGLELSELVLGGDPSGPPPPPARVSGRLRADGLAELITLEGEVRSRPGTIDLEAEFGVRGEGLRGAVLAQYLSPFGITPLLEDGQLALQATARLREVDGGWVAGLRMDGVELSEGGQALLSVDELEVEGLETVGGEIAVERVALVGPFARVTRDAEGGLRLGGVRVAAAEGEAATETSRAAVPTPLVLPTLPAVRVADIDLQGARLVWADEALDPPLEVEVEVDARAGSLSTRGEPGSFALELRIPGAVESLEVDGFIELSSELVSLDFTAEGRGLQAGPLGRLLPRGVSWGDQAGDLLGGGGIELRSAAAGGLSAQLQAGLALGKLQGARMGDSSGEEPPWLSLSELSVEVKRIDPVARVLELGDVTVGSVELDVWRDRAGTLHALGLELGSSPEDPPVATPEAQVSQLPARASSTPPRVALGNVRLGVGRFVLRDDALGEDARPLAGSLALSIEPSVLLDEAPSALVPISWRLEGALDGLIENWEVAGTLAPFAAEPRLEATLSATGVRTTDVLDFVPSLAGRVNGEVEAGEISGHLEALLSVRRSHPADLGLDRPFGGSLHVSELHFRDAPGGEVLVGVDGIDVEAKRIDTAKGLVHLDLVEVRTPRARLWREGMVVHAAGLALDLASGGNGQVSTTEASSAAEPKPVAQPSDPDEEQDPASKSDLRIDRFVLSGIDVEIADRTATPAVEILLTLLELETGRISTRDLARGAAISFSGELGAAAPEGRSPLFEELSLAGRVAPFPAPSGWVQLNLSALELSDLSGLAAQQGLTLDDGALDVSARLRLKGERGAGAGVTIVFSDLDVSEPEGGLLESLLSLPVTLDTALFLVRNADGEHRFAVNVDVGPDGIGMGAIASAAASAMAQVVVSAVAGAPLRLITSVVPGGDGEEPSVREVLELTFEPGGSELDAAGRARLAELAWNAHIRPSHRVVVRHQLCSGDLERAMVLANPAPAECLELVAGLRQRKAELWRRRDELAAQARALYAVGADEAGLAGDELRSVETDLAEVEHSIDRVLDVLRADSPRQQAKRARAAAREVAELRLETVADLLREALAESRPERLEVRPPRSAVTDQPGGGRVVVELIER